MTKKLIVRGLATISPLGSSRADVAAFLHEPYARAVPLESRDNRPIFRLTAAGEALVTAVSREERFAKLDRVAHVAIAAARETLSLAAQEHPAIGLVTIGSSRGATAALEQSISEFSHSASLVPVETSPTTTAGNISAWVAQEALRYAQGRDVGVQCSPVSLSTSMTCSSAFQSLIAAAAFIRSGMSAAAVFGGAEACLTPYTVAHLEALRIYADAGQRWPCRPCGASMGGGNSVVLGEGAGTAILMEDDGLDVDGDLALLGLGWSLEETPTATGLSADGKAFESSMRMAASQLPAGIQVDAVLLHAPGSIKGDMAELDAVRRVFEGAVGLSSTKHLTGHTYGASGMVSLAVAQALLEGAPWRGFPYPTDLEAPSWKTPRAIMINTAGFGGNSVSIVVGLKSKRF